MSTSKFELVVESAEPLSVVEIADGRYRLLKQGVRRVSEPLPAGLYVARVKYQDRVEERLIEHGRNTAPVRFGVDRAEKTAARRVRDSADMARQMKAVRGIGLRTWITVSIKAPGLSVLPALGRVALPPWSAFSICSLAGGTIANPTNAATDPDGANDAHDRILSQGLEVGWYSLRIPSRDGAPVFLPLYVSPQFSPTVLLEVGGVDERSGAWFDFSRLVVSYDAAEGDAYDNPVRLAALRAARRSLELGRNGLTSELMDVLYSQKFQDPMLGLFALQLLLLEPTKSKGMPTDRTVHQFDTVMSNMASALNLPQHPDLVLARAQARRLKWSVKPMKGDDEPLVAPPLLRANWNALVNMSSRRNELLGVNRPLRRVSEGLLQTGIWVMWKPPARPATTPSTDYVSLSFGETTAALQLREAVSLPAAPAAELEYAARVERPRDRAEVYANSGPPRPSRAVDAQLEEVVDQVRANQGLRIALQKRLQSDPPTSTVLERAVSRAVLQLAEIESQSKRNVPAGYAKRLSNDLAVPFALVGETVSRMRKELRAWQPYVDYATSLERSFLP